MSDAQTPGPTLTNTGTEPIKARKLFVNIPVNDLQKSIQFFEQLGFAFNPQFTDASATCMLVVGNSMNETSVLFAIATDSRDEVDSLFSKAIGAGATKAADVQDHGFMYVQSFYDLDGNHWELFWMDPSAMSG
jgi:predicted lactoylglutathione lyase